MDASNTARERIVSASRDLFLSEGIIRVTMDDIAAACGMSKKTLYAHFSSKEDLLHEVLLTLQHQLMANAKQALDSGLPLFKKITAVISTVTRQSWLFTPVFLGDIQKTAPYFWEELQEYRYNGIVESVRDLVREGKEQGFIQDRFPEQFILHICFSLIDDIMKNETMIKLSMSFQELFEHLMTLLFEGVLTESGRQALEQEMKTT